MSEKKSTTPDGALKDGFDGEGKDRAAAGGLPPQTESERSSSRRVSRETSSPTPEKNKRSSFFVYLAVLFGAAFLMLLLAYFVQQRNSETAYSDLQNTMNLSREELMEEIQGLEEEKAALEEEAARLQEERDSLAGEKSELERQLQNAQSDLDEARERAGVLTSFSILEQALRDKNYEIAAQQVRALCQPGRNLDLGIVGLDPSVCFDAKARLAEIIPLLEKRGALETGEVPIPAPEIG